MIRRDTATGLYFITQHDHALISAELLKKVGNALFAPPVPFNSVVSAAAEHDRGWQTHDRHPVLNPKKRPAHVFEITIEIALQAWSESVSAAQKTDPYAALLVSLHAMHLASVAHAKTPVDAFRIQQFFQNQAQLQESLRKKLGMHTDLPLIRGLAVPTQSDDEDLLLANFHLLQLIDQLSLILCFDRLVFDRVSNIYPRPISSPVNFRINQPSSGLFRIDPWPFAVQQIDVQIPARQLSDRQYQDEFDVAAAYSAAEPLQLSATLKTWQEV